MGENEVLYNTKSDQFKANLSKESAKRFKDVLFLNKNDAIISTYGRVHVESATKAKLSAKWGNNEEFPFRILRTVNSSHFIRQTDSTFYISHLDGFYYYTWGKSKLIKNKNKPFVSSALSIDDQGTIWLVTEKHELLEIRNDKVLKSYFLPFSVTNIISEGPVLFLSNNSIIYRLDIRTWKLDKFDKTDGVLSEKIINLYNNRDTLVLIGTHHMQKIPSSFKSFNSVAPIVRIENIKLFEKAIDRNDLNFNYGEDNITIEFSSSSIRSQGNYIFVYRLNEGNWSSTSSKAPFARFSNLAPGVYDFQVYVINEDGISSKVENLHFEIDSHFTQKWWFVLILILFSAMVISFLVQKRNQNKQRQKIIESERQRLKKELYKSKIAAIRSQMNPHFMFNALNTIQEFILTNQKEIASGYLADFADLMRKYLDQSMHEEIFLVDELEALEIYLRLENLRFDGNLLYSIECDSSINIFENKIPVMLLQPFIENSIKHGLLHKEGEKKLTLAIRKIEKHRIECCIEDNGIGRKASSKINRTKIASHNSFSTKAIDQKISLVNESSNKNLSIEVRDLDINGSVSGTRVIIQFDI
ncbi:MAG: histidine kinase [Crocinitomicaceae bacterium]